MQVAERKQNPFINSSAGGRTLSALQLPLFLLRPPAGYGVITTTGRRTGKRRRRCLRAIRRGDRVYVVAIKGAGTGWVKNALANPDVRLRLRGGTFSGRAREPRDAAERRDAAESYCDTVHPFDYATCANWRKGRPTPAKVKDLFRGWFDEGTPLVVELDT